MGAGESSSVRAAAVANALFDALGVRMRKLHLPLNVFCEQ